MKSPPLPWLRINTPNEKLREAGRAYHAFSYCFLDLVDLVFAEPFYLEQVFRGGGVDGLHCFVSVHALFTRHGPTATVCKELAFNLAMSDALTPGKEVRAPSLRNGSCVLTMRFQ